MREKVRKQKGTESGADILLFLQQLNSYREESRVSAVNLNQALSEAELAELEDFLESDFVPLETMDLSMLDGYLTAIAVGPELVLASRWLPRVWGDTEQPEFSSLEHANHILGLLVRYHNQIVLSLRDAPESFSPLFDEYEDEDSEAVISAEGWCAGFSLGVHLAAEAWEPLFEDEQASQLLTPIIAFSMEEATKELREAPDAAAMEAALITMLPSAVLGIYDYWQPARAKRKPGLVNDNFPLGGNAKTGRNALCPCGSGKKFKKCCGAP